MSDIVHTGGCHCGRVRFEVDAPARLEVFDCNCSICRRTGYLHLIVPRARFRLLGGGESLVVYQVGCIAALCADSDEAAIRDALPFLAEALMGNPSLAEEAAKDADLKRLQSAEKFQKLLDAAKLLTDTQAGKAQAEAPVQPPNDAEIIEQEPIP